MSDIASPSAKNAPNPFDIFDTQAMPQRSAPIAEIDAPADPRSIRVGRQEVPTSVVETIVNHSMVGSIPQASMAPANWSQGCQTPNPVADILLRQECTDGLWATYPAERAAECADMWNTLSGNHHGCASGCNSCGTAGGCGAVVGCHSGHKPVLNRYRQHHAAPATCGSVAPSTCGCSQCDSGVSNLPPQHQGHMFPVAAPAPVPQNVQAQTPQNKVAFLPQAGVR